MYKYWIYLHSGIECYVYCVKLVSHVYLELGYSGKYGNKMKPLEKIKPGKRLYVKIINLPEPEHRKYQKTISYRDLDRVINTSNLISISEENQELKYFLWFYFGKII
jgi:hypothetical protein